MLENKFESCQCVSNTAKSLSFFFINCYYNYNMILMYCILFLCACFLRCDPLKNVLICGLLLAFLTVGLLIGGGFYLFEVKTGSKLNEISPVWGGG